ncbi:BON domain-containing protein [Gemmatimonas sp.]|uniref:BON domain-containing protein n=1 Tax=Gemmatimonas sp. TaxID=1962908 RepID=UPI00286C1C6C|nr:BON domain-containing protein [Gemmatimonas sp.]
MAQSPFRKRPTRTSSVLLVALGAVAGVALGMLVADRVGGVDGLLRRGGRGSRRQPGPEGWRGDERRTDSFDELADDDSELSGESIAHMHVRRRGEPSASVPEAMPDRLSTRERLRDRMRDRRTRSMEPQAAVSPLADAVVIPMGPSVPTHEELESRVLEAFRHDPVLEARAIDIGAVGAGAIELTGWVESTGEIAHALTLARGVPDVTSVVDHLAVRGPGSIQSHRTAQYETPHRR